MTVIPYRLLVRVAHPCRYIKDIPQEHADRLLDLPETCRLENFAAEAENPNFADVASPGTSWVWPGKSR